MPSENLDKPINFSPRKSFFLKTFIKDIDLTDAILDLIDNSIDSHIEKNIVDKRDVKLILSRDNFVIEDNCGGIKKDRIYDDVFRFGKKSEDIRETIGVFGVGLKRSIFKMGKDILIESDDGEYFFTVHIDENWLNDEDKWNLPSFEFDGPTKGTPLLRITIRDLFSGIADELGNQVFINNLITKIKRTYPILINRRVNIVVNEYLIKPEEFKLLYGEGFLPLHKNYKIDSVDIEIYAGFTNKVSKDDPYGWYVFCNDRLVLDKDTTNRTGWGDESATYHYPQDNYFMGFIFFRSQNPSSLPWQTTKDSVQLDSGLYRQTQVDMRQITKKFVRVMRAVHRAKDETGTTIGKSFFEGVPLKPILEISEMHDEMIPEIQENPPIVSSQSIEIPQANSIPEELLVEDGEEIQSAIRSAPRNITLSSIQYMKDKDLIKKVKKSLGNPYMPNKDAGEKTFDYYVEMEEIEKSD